MHGFRETGILPGYCSDDVDALSMVKRVSPFSRRPVGRGVGLLFPCFGLLLGVVWCFGLGLGFFKLASCPRGTSPLFLIFGMLERDCGTGLVLGVS